MIDIPIDNVLELPVKDIIAGECVAYGVVDEGILIHYLERDIVRLIEWEDIIGLGIGSSTQMVLPEKADKNGIRETIKPEIPHYG